MQPEDIEDSTELPAPPNSVHSASSQHGFQDHGLLLPELLREQQDGFPAGFTPSTASAMAFDGQRSVNIDDTSQNVLPSSTSLTSEQWTASSDGAVTPPSIQDGDGNTISGVWTSHSSTRDRRPFDAIPNEVLTHILSHLPASSLSAASLVSKRFYALVTTPHAWRVAFSRYFAGQDSITDRSEFQSNHLQIGQEPVERLRSERRFFTRLTALASWRSEYIIRMRLLRALGRGKPTQNPTQYPSSHASSSRSTPTSNAVNAVVTYNSQLFSTINHIHATFSKGMKSPRFVHGSDETGSACTSDPSLGKVDNWGLSDPQSLPQFVDLFPGDALYGLGAGLSVGVPNVMDVSQPIGIIYGEGWPGGQGYFRPIGEMRGRFLGASTGVGVLEAGIPQINPTSEAITAVWLAKSYAIPNMTSGLIGIITGSSCGAVAAYSLGVNDLRGIRLEKGELTTRWMVSPGVPIIAISVDEAYNNSRMEAGRIWAVVLNALGEVYYLTDPLSRRSEHADYPIEEKDAAIAWRTGQNAYWHLVEKTRRVARDDPYKEAEFDANYLPRFSPNYMTLDEYQRAAETEEIQKFLSLSPAHFRKVYHGWDMQRLLEVDFAGDDGNGAGENVVVISCGIEDSENAKLERFTRLKSKGKSPNISLQPPKPVSLFGPKIGQSPPSTDASSSPSRGSISPGKFNCDFLTEEWKSSILSVGDFGSSKISACSIDKSTFALLTVMEDPLLSQIVSSPIESLAQEGDISLHNVPGHRARFLAVGNKAGTIIIWNIRSALSHNSEVIQEVQPLRAIQTDSPQISCLALSALYLIHGGNDGLVQCWDPLASTLQPTRTLHSRFSSRARRRLVQAEASAQGVGINLYAAGAIAIDPDPTSLRGMVSLGTHLRYWSYSSLGVDQNSGKKRKVRRSSERGTNSGADKIFNSGRGALMDYIAKEHDELKQERQRQDKEQAHLRGRFGVGLHGLDEDDALRYAEMISREEYLKDKERRLSEVDITANSSAQSISVFDSLTITPEGSITDPSSSPLRYKSQYQLEHDIEEAIRVSLIDGVDDNGNLPGTSRGSDYDIPFTYKRKKASRSTSSSPSGSQASNARAKLAGKINEPEIAIDDLDFAIQLSLAEERSRFEAQTSEFPELPETTDRKGKGRSRLP